MGLREKMNENPAITMVVTLVIIVAAIWFMWSRIHRTPPRPNPPPPVQQPQTPAPNPG